MPLQYIMKANHTVLARNVFWAVTGAPDNTGAFSGYNPGDLTSIVTDYTTDVSASFAPGSVIFTNTVSSATVSTEESTASTSYADLTTPGPSVTLVTGTNAVVTLSTYAKNSSAAAGIFTSLEVSGATTIAASDTYVSHKNQEVAAKNSQMSRTVKITGLTPGTNTFKMKYRVDAGTGTWGMRDITVATNVPGNTILAVTNFTQSFATSSTVADTTRYVFVTATGQTISLPASPVTGQTIDINAPSGTTPSATTIVSGNGKTINGSSTYTMTFAYERQSFVYNGTEWRF